MTVTILTCIHASPTISISRSVFSLKVSKTLKCRRCKIKTKILLLVQHNLRPKLTLDQFKVCVHAYLVFFLVPVQGKHFFPKWIKTRSYTCCRSNMFLCAIYSFSNLDDQSFQIKINSMLFLITLIINFIKLVNSFCYEP